MRVIERRQDLGLPFEAGQADFISGEFFRQGLDRDIAVEPPVVSSVDDAHAACA